MRIRPRAAFVVTVSLATPSPTLTINPPPPTVSTIGPPIATDRADAGNGDAGAKPR